MDKITTTRLVLRPLSITDVNDIYEYAVDDEIGPSAGWTPHKTIEETTRIVEFMLTEGDVYAITLRDTGKLIGTLGLHKKDILSDSKELGYVLNKTYWHQGFMTEACKAVLIYTFEIEKTDRIVVKHFKYNEKSKNVINRLGFKFLKEDIKKIKIYGIELTRETLEYEMTRTEYERKRLIWQQH